MTTLTLVNKQLADHGMGNSHVTNMGKKELFLVSHSHLGLAMAKGFLMGLYKWTLTDAGETPEGYPFARIDTGKE